MRGHRYAPFVGEHREKQGHLSATHVLRRLHLTTTAMPAHVKANPVEVSLLRLEAIVFVTKYLAHLLQQTLGLRMVGDGVRHRATFQPVPSDILGR